MNCSTVKEPIYKSHDLHLEDHEVEYDAQGLHSREERDEGIC